MIINTHFLSYFNLKMNIMEIHLFQISVCMFNICSQRHFKLIVSFSYSFNLILLMFRSLKFIIPVVHFREPFWDPISVCNGVLEIIFRRGTHIALNPWLKYYLSCWDSFKFGYKYLKKKIILFYIFAMEYENIEKWGILCK